MAYNEKLSVTVTVTAEDQFSDWLAVRPDQEVAISISGTFVATIFLQRRMAGVTGDVESWTAVTEQTYEADASAEVRIGCKTGGFTSGTAVCRLRKSN